MGPSRNRRLGHNIRRSIAKSMTLTALGISLCFVAVSAAGERVLWPATAPLRAEKELQLDTDPWVKRWRTAKIDSKRIFSASPASGPLTFHLFGDVHVRAHILKRKTLESGSTFLFGALEGVGHFTLLMHVSGIVLGEFDSPYGTYKLGPAPKEGLLLVKQLDSTKFSACGVVGDGIRTGGASQDTQATRHGGPIRVASTDRRAQAKGHLVSKTPSAPGFSKPIDVLVLYDQRTEDKAGGPQAFVAAVEHHVAYANQALENSGLSHRWLRVIAMEKRDDLVRFDIGDGSFDLQLVEKLGADHGAALVHSFFSSGIGQAFGAGSIASPEYWHRYDCRYSENYALCLKNRRRSGAPRPSRSSIGGGLTTFAHEIGHSLGQHHDRYSVYEGNVGDGDHVFDLPEGEFLVDALGELIHSTDLNYWTYPTLGVGSYGHAHVFGSGSSCFSLGTIMAYPDLAIDAGCGVTDTDGWTGSSRAYNGPYYSTPNLTYPRPNWLDGSFGDWPDVAMGVAGDEVVITGVNGPVNATRSIDLVWDTFAEAPSERLPDACNEGDVARNVLAEYLPASIDIASADERKSFAVSLSAPEACVDDVALRARSPEAVAWYGEWWGLSASWGLSVWPNGGHFGVSGAAGARHQLEVTASDDHYGACSATRRSLAVTELTDHVQVDWDRVLQKVPGTRRHGIALRQGAAHSFCEGAPARQLRRLGDFNGDGKADVLLRHADGTWLYQPMDGPNVLPGGMAGLPRNPTISVAGVGDFNGDGKDDMLMRLSSGAWRYYPMDGRDVLPGRGEVALPTDLAWEVAGILDFNGDGKDDVLMRRLNGEFNVTSEAGQYADDWRLYAMDGRTVLGEGVPGGLHAESTVSTWVAGVGDFDGDGRDDALLRRIDGTWHYLPFSRNVDDRIYWFSGHGAVALTDDLAWTAAGIADFNGDGKDDVLLRHEDGRWLYQPMDGKELLEGGGVPELPADPEVWLAGVGDLNGDGLADVLTRRGHEAWEYWPAKPFSWIATPFGGYRYDEGRPDLNPGEIDLASGPAWGVLKGGVEDPPRVRAQLLDQPLAIGSDAALDLSLYFSDGQALTFNVASSDTDVVRVSVADNVLTLAPVADGRATVAVTARDADGYVVRQTFQTAVSEDGQVGRRFRDCPECPEMVVVPAGSFMMGSPEEEEGGPRSDQRHERPQHRVEFAAPFAIGVFEVTYEQWDACVAEGGCRDDVERHSFDETGPNHPVYRVNWNDAQAYVEWLAAKTGQAYRLPSDAEWEYAARAGTTTPFHFGETITTDQANYDGEVPSSRRYEGDEASSYALANPGIYRGRPVPVGSLPANPWGLHEVHGNVSEWTQDCFDGVGYAGWPADGSAVESGDCDQRYLRNGSFYDDPGDVRSARRKVWPADFLYGFSGFRVAKTLGD